ncbi:MAG TPA: HAD family hydrolase [Acidimicrobiales bacterium]|nr:HAD family hydrolase [Acidimicrobiales bacterium]
MSMRVPENEQLTGATFTAADGTTRTVKLVATDLDGTLLRADSAVSDRTRSELDRLGELGVHFVPVTARGPRLIEMLGPPLTEVPIVVAANGALLYDPIAAEIVRENVLSAPDALDAVARIREHIPDVAFGIESMAGYRREEAYWSAFPFPPGMLVGPAEELIDGPVVKLLARHVDKSTDNMVLMAEIQRALEGTAEAATAGAPALVEVTAKGVNKGSGLAFVADQLGVGLNEVLAFGDMPNDLPMLRAAGYAVAVANASPDVLRVADEVTASHDEDGVALVLARIS